MKFYHHNPKAFGNRLKHFRIHTTKLTQSELAAKCGLSASWISHFENGNRSPGIENLIRLAWGLGISLDRLCGADLWLKAKPKKGVVPLVGRDGYDMSREGYNYDSGGFHQ